MTTIDEIKWVLRTALYKRPDSAPYSRENYYDSRIKAFNELEQGQDFELVLRNWTDAEVKQLTLCQLDIKSVRRNFYVCCICLCGFVVFIGIPIFIQRENFIIGGCIGGFISGILSLISSVKNIVRARQEETARNREELKEYAELSAEMRKEEREAMLRLRLRVSK